MKLVIPNIVWHGEKERIMTLAIQPNTNLLLTGGTDARISEEDNTAEEVGVIKMWTILENSQKMVEFVGALNSGHQKAVNCIRFSPDGKQFASASDDYSIIVWSQQIKQGFGQSEPKLQWWRMVMLTGHCKEIYDLSWSKSGELLVSGGLDKNVIVWNVKKQKQLQTLDGHQSYVQGVVIDPRTKMIVSLSQDRTVRVWRIQKNNKKTLNSVQFYPQYTVRKVDQYSESQQSQQLQQPQQPQQSQQNQNSQQNKTHGMFLGETSLQTFVRRPDWSPDGTFYILPAAEFWIDDKPIPGAYGFMRQAPQNACFFLPTGKPAVVIKFCPKIFQKSTVINTNQLIDLPYKIIFAIATIDQLFVYSSESQTPLAMFGNIHYAPITDISFRSNLIAVSSSDGYCSFVQIEEGYFGKETSMDQLPEYIRQIFEEPEKLEGISQQQSQQQYQQQQQQQQQNSEQRVEFRETLDGKKKKIIVPKTIS